MKREEMLLNRFADSVQFPSRSSHIIGTRHLRKVLVVFTKSLKCYRVAGMHLARPRRTTHTMGTPNV